MAIPKTVSFVTFDVYGTLIDWETGACEAFKAEAAKDGFTIERDELIPLFHEVQQKIQAGSYELYAEVLRRTAVDIAKQIGWPLEPSRSGFLPESVQRWKPFKETNPVLTKIKKKYEIGLISNIDDKLLGQTRRHIPVDFDLVVTAQQVRSYKPDPAHFTECERRIGSQEGLGPHRRELLPRRRAVPEEEDSGDLGQPPQAGARVRAEEARRGGPEPPRGDQADRPVGGAQRGARPRRPRGRPRVRQRLLADDRHRDPRRRRGVPDRLAGAARGARRAAAGARAVGVSRSRGCSPPTPTGITCSGGQAFPEAALGVGASSAERLAAEPGAAQRAVRDFDEQWYVVRERPLSLGAVQSLPEPGKLEIGGGREIAVLPASGHTADGVAFWCDWLGLLVCGDYLSPVEIPMLSPGGSLEAYLETLARLEPAVRTAETIVPGHGGAIGRDGALRVLEEDRAYLEALRERGDSAELPAPRRTEGAAADPRRECQPGWSRTAQRLKPGGRGALLGGSVGGDDRQRVAVGDRRHRRRSGAP